MFSVICSIKNHDVFESVLLPSLNPIKDYLNNNKLPDLQVVEVCGETSICENYNRAILQCKFKTKFFIHEDVDLMDNNLNPLFCRVDFIFNSFPDTGLVGLVGTKGNPRGFWWECNRSDIVGQVLSGKQKEFWLWTVNESFDDVNYIDGMFMATNTDLKFSEDIKGFHLYDLDYCNVMRKNNYKIKVIPHLVNHVSAVKDICIDKSYYQNKWNL